MSSPAPLVRAEVRPSTTAVGGLGADQRSGLLRSMSPSACWQHNSTAASTRPSGVPSDPRWRRPSGTGTRRVVGPRSPCPPCGVLILPRRRGPLAGVADIRLRRVSTSAGAMSQTRVQGRPLNVFEIGPWPDAGSADPEGGLLLSRGLGHRAVVQCAPAGLPSPG